VIRRGGDEDGRPTVYTTGIGCTQHGKLIADTLDVKYVFIFLKKKLFIGLKYAVLSQRSLYQWHQL